MKKAICLLVLLMFAAAIINSCGGGGSSSGSNGGDGRVTGTVILSSTVSQAATLKAASTYNKTNLRNVSSAIAYATAGNTVPAPGVICTVEGTDKSGTTDQNGFFTINDVSPGSHILICKKTAADGNTYAFLRIVEVANGQTLDIGTLEITLAGKIQGKATLSGQTDNAGIKVYIPGTSMQATTDSTGAFLIINIPEGTYELRFENAGYMTVTLPGIVVNAGQSKIVSDIALNISTGASGGILIANGSPYSTSRTVTNSITASSNATLMQISENSNFVGATWQPIATSTIYTFLSDGQKRLYIKFSDANGLESAPVSDDIIVDTAPPTNGSITINMGTPTTNSTSITLTLSATDATTSVSQMMLSNSSDFSSAAWETYTGTRSWTLPSGDGAKTVYAKFKDLVGNETAAAVTASILLDTQNPTNAGGSIQEGGYTNNRLIHLSLTSSSATFMKISEDSNFTNVSSISYAATATFTLSSGDGSKTVYVRYLDDAGNFVDFTMNPIVLDTIIPTTPVIFNTNQTTNQTNFSLTLTTTSNDANFKTYQLMGGQYAAWSDTAETGPFSFTLSQQGANTLSIRGKDQAGNIGSAASIVVTLDTAAPVLSNISVAAMGTSATIQWSTNESTTGMVEYGLNTSYGSTKTDSNSATNHTATITGLSELTTYNYRISSTDSGNNITTSTNLTFKTGHEVSGNIASSTTWLAAGGPYVIIGDVGIPAGVTLTIEAGTTIQYAGAYTVLVKGAVIANGNSVSPIIFTATTGLSNSGATQIKFQDTNIGNSQMTYVAMEKASKSVAIATGNSGILTISNSTINASAETSLCSAATSGTLSYNCTGDSTTIGLTFSNSTIANTSVTGVYPHAAKILISSCTVTGSTLNADAYHVQGITVSSSTVSNSTLLMGCCSAKMRLDNNSILINSTISAGMGTPVDGPLQLSYAQLTNTSIDLPSAQAVISDSTITYNSSYAGTTRVRVGNGTLSYSRIIGNGNGTGLEITGNAGYSATGSFAISYSDITGHDSGIVFSGGSGSFGIGNSNINSNTSFGLKNLRTGSATGANNYWGTTSTSTIDSLIFDGNDNINYGIVTYVPILNTTQAGTGPR